MAIGRQVVDSSGKDVTPPVIPTLVGSQQLNPQGNLVSGPNTLSLGNLLTGQNNSPGGAAETLDLHQLRTAANVIYWASGPGFSNSVTVPASVVSAGFDDTQAWLCSLLFYAIAPVIDIAAGGVNLIKSDAVIAVIKQLGSDQPTLGLGNLQGAITAAVESPSVSSGLVVAGAVADLCISLLPLVEKPLVEAITADLIAVFGPLAAPALAAAVEAAVAQLLVVAGTVGGAFAGVNLLRFAYTLYADPQVEKVVAPVTRAYTPVLISNNFVGPSNVGFINYSGASVNNQGTVLFYSYDSSVNTTQLSLCTTVGLLTSVTNVAVGVGQLSFATRLSDNNQFAFVDQTQTIEYYDGTNLMAVGLPIDPQLLPQVFSLAMSSDGTLLANLANQPAPGAFPLVYQLYTYTPTNGWMAVGPAAADIFTSKLNSAGQVATDIFIDSVNSEQIFIDPKAGTTTIQMGDGANNHVQDGMDLYLNNAGQVLTTLITVLSESPNFQETSQIGVWQAGGFTALQEPTAYPPFPNGGSAIQSYTGLNNLGQSIGTFYQNINVMPGSTPTIGPCTWDANGGCTPISIIFTAAVPDPATGTTSPSGTGVVPIDINDNGQILATVMPGAQGSQNQVQLVLLDQPNVG